MTGPVRGLLFTPGGECLPRLATALSSRGIRAAPPTADARTGAIAGEVHELARLLRECHICGKNVIRVGMRSGSFAGGVLPAARHNFARSRKLADSQWLVWIVPNNRKNAVRHTGRAAGAPAIAPAEHGSPGDAAGPRIPRGDSSSWIVTPAAAPETRQTALGRCRKRFLRASERLCNVQSLRATRGFKQSSGVHAHQS
jgi:hypothetical protein